MKNMAALLGTFLCLALAGCTDADWENTMSFLPMERGTGPSVSTQTQAQPNALASASPTTNAFVSLQDVATPQRQATATVTGESSIRHCQSVATQRAADGSYMGMDEDAQKQEYDLTYADCMRWEAAHGG
jgi:hypothetical protein